MTNLHSNCLGYEAVELIKNKLSFVIVDQGSPLPFSDNIHLYFTTDESFLYTPLKDDYGPLNLGLLYKYCKLLKEKIEEPANKDKRMYHATNGDDVTRTNAAVLAGAFMIMVMNSTAEDTYAAIRTLKHTFVKFHDCWRSPNTPGISLLDCYKGIERAIASNFFNYSTFNVQEYDMRQEVANGDMNWIIPGKIIAFKGPRTTPKAQPSFPPCTFLFDAFN
jgi:cell division cycle 14